MGSIFKGLIFIVFLIWVFGFDGLFSLILISTAVGLLALVVEKK